MKKTVITVMLKGLEVKNNEKDCYYCYFLNGLDVKNLEKDCYYCYCLNGLEVKNNEKDCYYCYFKWFGGQKPRKRLLLLLF